MVDVILTNSVIKGLRHCLVIPVEMRSPMYTLNVLFHVGLVLLVHVEVEIHRSVFPTTCLPVKLFL